MKAEQVCTSLMTHRGPFPRRRYIAVPNVYWGWGLNYEADVIVISGAGICSEIEIKVSKYDLLNDKNKLKWSRGGLDERISAFYYAVPKALESDALAAVNPEFGVISVEPDRRDGTSVPWARIVRPAKRRKARKATPDEITKILHLGLMRYWDLRMADFKTDSTPNPAEKKGE